MSNTKPLIRELTPELADKIIEDFKKRQYDQEVSKKAVLHHLKQLKAQMGKYKKAHNSLDCKQAIDVCMIMIDKKIKKIEP